MKIFLGKLLLGFGLILNLAWAAGSDVMRTPSPDGRWILIVSPISQYEHALDLQEAGSGHPRRIKVYDRALRVGWSPDSRAFYMNDAYGSNQEDAFVHWVDKKEAKDLGAMILSKDREALKLGADHQYFHAYRWADARTVEVEYCGHTSYAPAQQFDFLYRVGLGRPLDVVRISGTVRPVTFPLQECKY